MAWFYRSPRWCRAFLMLSSWYIVIRITRPIQNEWAWKSIVFSCHTISRLRWPSLSLQSFLGGLRSQKLKALFWTPRSIRIPFFGTVCQTRSIVSALSLWFNVKVRDFSSIVQKCNRNGLILFSDSQGKRDHEQQSIDIFHEVLYLLLSLFGDNRT